MVEGTGLENQQGCKPFVGSNPTLSAKCYKEQHCRSNFRPDCFAAEAAPTWSRLDRTFGEVQNPSSDIPHSH